MQTRDRSLKILVTLFDLHMGGISSLLLRTLPYYNNSAKIHVLYFGKNETRLTEFLAHDSIIIRRIEYNGWISLPKVVCKFVRFVKENAFDIIHTHFYTDSLIVALSKPFVKSKCVTTLHSSDSPYNLNPTLLQYLKLRIEEYFRIVWFDGVLAVSDACKQDWVINRGVNGLRIKVLYNGVSGLEPAGLRSVLRQVNGSVSFVTCCRLYPIKGIPRLVKVLSALNRLGIEWKLIIAGDGPDFEDIKKYAFELGVSNRVEMKGMCNDVSLVLKEAHFYINSSYSESMPISILEALSFGIPVLGSAVGGIPEIIQDGHNGLLLNFRNEEQVIEKIVGLVNLSQEQYEELSYNARRSFEEKFSVEKHVVELNRYYELLGKV
jgi:L-malate glycosyltransferase